MPSTNTSIATATDVGTNPFTLSQDVNDTAPPLFEVWFKYTAAVGEEILGLWAGAPLASNYAPAVTVWVGPIGSPTEFMPIAGDAVNIPIIVPVVAGETYYIRVQSLDTADPRTGNLTLSGKVAPQGGVPINSLMVNDDTAGFPLVAMGPDAVPIHLFGLFPAGECAAILPDGTLMVEGRIARLLSIYTAALVHVTTLAFPAGSGGDMGGISSDQVDTFYVGRGLANTQPQVNTISTAGVVGATAWLLPNPGVSQQLGALAPSRDESILYYHTGVINGSLMITFNEPIKRWDLIGNVALADLAPGVPLYARTRDLLVLADGTILSGLFRYSGLGNPIVRRYSAAGATIQDYAFPAGCQIDHLTLGNDDPLSFWAWIYTQNVDADFFISQFLHIRVADGALLSTGAITQYEEGVFQGPPEAAPVRFAPSRSCAFWIQRSAIAPPTTGTIVVRKVTIPNTDLTDFAYTTTGLTPATFSLHHGQSITYSGLAPGSGYGVAETPDPLFVTSAVVSDGSPLDALNLAAGETITVTFTNTLASPPPPPPEFTLTGCPEGLPLTAAPVGCVAIDGLP